MLSHRKLLSRSQRDLPFISVCQVYITGLSFSSFLYLSLAKSIFHFTLAPVLICTSIYIYIYILLFPSRIPIRSPICPDLNNIAFFKVFWNLRLIMIDHYYLHLSYYPFTCLFLLIYFFNFSTIYKSIFSILIIARLESCFHQNDNSLIKEKKNNNDNKFYFCYLSIRIIIPMIYSRILTIFLPKFKIP